MVNKKNIISTLKGRVRYFGSVPESFLRVVFDLIYQVTLSAQKAAVRYFIRSLVTPKRNLIRLQNQTIVSQLSTVLCCVQTLKHTVTDGFRDRESVLRRETRPVFYICAQVTVTFLWQGRPENTFQPCQVNRKMGRPHYLMVQMVKNMK